MGWMEIASFAAVAGLLVMSPGPNGILIAKTVPSSGRGAGFANIAGFVAAFYVHGALSILGISIILVRSAEAFWVLKMLGAAYLIWLGLKALRDACRGLPPVPVTAASKRRAMWTAFAEGFLTNALNPKVAMFYLAAFPQFISSANGLTPSAVAEVTLLLVTIHAALNVVWFSSMVVLFAHMAGLASRTSVRRWLKAVTGAVFVGFGVKLALLRA